MALAELFQIQQAGLFHGVYSAEVVSVKDDKGMGRVQIRLLSLDGFESQDSLMWARVAAPFAGPKRGAFFIPNVKDEVLVAFLNGDPRFPMVIGSMWHANAQAPEKLPGDEVDRWTITGKEGSRIAIVETSKSAATVSFTLPGDVSGELTASGGGKIEFKTPTGTISIDQSGITVRTTGAVTVQGATVDITAPQVNITSAMSVFSGTIQCLEMHTTATVSGSYTPGAGNVW